MGLEAGNLRKLIHPELHIDEFKSKLGDDDEICVISFKVNGKEPAQDLVNFIEKGYDWVVDADVSSGEMDDGDYIVFLEINRDRELPENVMDMMEDIMATIAGQDVVLTETNDLPLAAEGQRVDGPLPAASLQAQLRAIADQFTEEQQQILEQLRAAEEILACP